MPRYIGEIRLFAGNYAPFEWMICEGQLLSIDGYRALFDVIGTTYGGDGVTTFALPDLRSRTPIHQGENFALGKTGGVEEVTLDVGQIPSHTHAPIGDSDPATSNSPGTNVLLGECLPPLEIYRTNLTSAIPMSPENISPAGGSQPHTNLQPFLVINFIIAFMGDNPTPG